jgi:hypothetical protein
VKELNRFKEEKKKKKRKEPEKSPPGPVPEPPSAQRGNGWQFPPWATELGTGSNSSRLLLSLSMDAQPGRVEALGYKVPHKQGLPTRYPLPLSPHKTLYFLLDQFFGDFLPGAYRHGHRGPGTQRPPPSPPHPHPSKRTRKV